MTLRWTEDKMETVDNLREWINWLSEMTDQSAVRIREFLERELSRRLKAGRKGGRPVERTDPEAEARRRAYRVRMLKKRGIRD